MKSEREIHQIKEGKWTNVHTNAHKNYLSEEDDKLTKKNKIRRKSSTINKEKKNTKILFSR